MASNLKLLECFSSSTVPRTYTNPSTSKPSWSFFSLMHNSHHLISFTSKISPSKNVQFIAQVSNSARKDFVEDIIGLGNYGKSGKNTFPKSPPEGKIYVGNLPYDFDSEKLGVMFGQAGYVESSEIIYNRQINQSRGFGFVTMRTAQEAENAVKMFNQYDINGRPLTVNKATPRGSEPARIARAYEPSFRMYVGNLPWQVDNAQLEQLFCDHGKILDARIVYDRDNGRSRGFGFVTMSTEAELNNAIAAVNGQNLDGREISVTIAEQKPRT